MIFSHRMNEIWGLIEISSKDERTRTPEPPESG
jgi:hypothetical protein